MAQREEVLVAGAWSEFSLQNTQGGWRKTSHKPVLWGVVLPGVNQQGLLKARKTVTKYLGESTNEYLGFTGECSRVNPKHKVR